MPGGAQGVYLAHGILHPSWGHMEAHLGEVRIAGHGEARENIARHDEYNSRFSLRLREGRRLGHLHYPARGYALYNLLAVWSGYGTGQGGE